MPALLLHESGGDKMSQKNVINNFQSWRECRWYAPGRGMPLFQAEDARRTWWPASEHDHVLICLEKQAFPTVFLSCSGDGCRKEKNMIFVYKKDLIKEIFYIRTT